MPPRGRMDARANGVLATLASRGARPAHDEEVALRRVLPYRRGVLLPRLFFCACRLRAEAVAGTRRRAPIAGAWNGPRSCRGAENSPCDSARLLAASPYFHAGAWTRGSSRTLPISWARTLMVSSPSTGAERHTITSPGFTGLTPSGVPV
jgi:hypothetical protein